MDEEFCEVDFTTATSWETFTARLEEIFFTWNLCQVPEDTAFENCESFTFNLDTWFRKNEKVEFEGKEYEISFYHRQSNHLNQTKNAERKEETESISDEMSINPKSARDVLPLDVNCLSKNVSKFGFNEKLTKLIRIYDLQDFVLLTPYTESSNVFASETAVKLLMSSFCIAAYNTRCYVPIFLQVYYVWQNCFLGVSVNEDGFRVDYQMIHLAKVPPKLQYFPGLVDLFKAKIALVSLDSSVWASVKFSYSISDFAYFAWPAPPRPAIIPQDDSEEQEIEQISFSLPFTAACEPINELHLHVAWPRVYENMIMDTENHSDFEPSVAPYWALKIYSKETKHLLGQHISQVLHICQSSTILNDLIGDLLKRKNFSPVDVNVPSSLSLSKIISGGNINNSGSGNFNETKRSKKFLSEDILVSMLYYLFPDADAENTHPYAKTVPEDAKEDIFLKRMKTCSVDDLPWRLSVIMCITVHSFGEHAAAQFWYEFTQELRFRWDKCLKIPGVQKGVPNHKTSLLNQKLQMLNCCIQKRIKRENIHPLSEDSDDQNLPTKYDSEDEEFFDCQTESKEVREDGETTKTARISLWNQPEGRLRKFNNLRLIETGDYMYIPITQEMTPKTEDQLEDDAVVLMKLGSDSQGSQLRARMMCASLYSDMESFKAANPGAILEDFIRWYSPRDWIESSELDKYGQKKLSNRMLLPGNMWKEVWDNSIPVPACRQKCLFDDVKESEKVLHFFESHKNLSDVFSLLLPTLLHAGLYVVVNDDKVKMMRRYSPALNERINLLIQKAVSATRNNLDLSQYKIVTDEISDIERIVMRYNSLQYKLFPDDNHFQEDERKMLIDYVLGESEEIIIPNGSDSKLGRRIIYLFAKEAEHKSAMHTSTIEKGKKTESSFISSTNEALHHTASSISNAIAHHRGSEARHNVITSPPFQREFVLHATSSLPYITSRPGSHNLTAHICSEEIFLATNIIRDSVFV